MTEQVLSVEQMQELIDMGIDVSKASIYWSVNKANARGRKNDLMPPFLTFHKINQVVGLESFEYIPTFTLQDILTYLEKIKPILTRDDDSIWFMEVHNLERDSLMYCEGCESESPLETAFKTLKWCVQNHYI